MHQSIPAVLRSPLLLRGICPPCQSLGWGLRKFSSARGLGICQPRGVSQAFDTHIVSYWNITTQRGFYKKNKHIGLFLKDRKQLKRFVKARLSLILCMYFFIAYLSSQIYMVTSGAMDVNQRFSVMLIKN